MLVNWRDYRNLKVPVSATSKTSVFRASKPERRKATVCCPVSPGSGACQSQDRALAQNMIRRNNTCLLRLL